MEKKYIFTLIHASAFFAPVIVPIITLLLFEDRQVKKISIQAMLFHLLMVVLLFISGILSFVIIGLPFLVIFGIMAFVVPIIGIIKSLDGTVYEYPIIRRFT